MIAFNFEYYKPDNLEEAFKLFDDLDSSGKKVIYYGGGSEFISMARMNNVYADAVIDIKGIQDCNEYKLEDGKLIIGAGLSLTEIARANLFPLLTMAVKRIADHTMQGKISIGGNICGTIIYRESVLPLLVSDSQIVIGSVHGQRTLALKDIFQERLQLEKGEMLVKILIPERFLSLAHCHVKRTKNEVIDYPLVSMVALKNKDRIHMAFSGLGDYPFRSMEMEDILNNDKLHREDRIKKAVASIDDKIKANLSGSKEFKSFMVYNVIESALEKLQEVK